MFSAVRRCRFDKNNQEIIMRHRSNIIFALVSLLAGCGGGTSGGTPVTAPVSPPASSLPASPPPASSPPASSSPPAAAEPAGTAVQDAPMPAGWRLVWSDEFDGNGLPNPGNWDYDTWGNQGGWPNGELQYYARGRQENARVENGVLKIEARKERLTSASDYGGQEYTSARLVTRGKQEWLYGFVEIRAKLPCGTGTWPALWTLGSGGKWPDDGEIDIMEHVGRNKGEILGTIHTLAYNHTKNTQQGSATRRDDVCDAFHRYQLTWTATEIKIGIDDKSYFQFRNPGDGNRDKWPFDRPQYLLLNLAMGGTLGGAVDDAALPARMEIDYVRVYQP
jgi:beta-glucanase (GH16 family)